MITEVKMYTAVCDCCGKSNEDSFNGICAWACPDTARETAMNDNWIEDGDKLYCPDCFDYDDEDNLIIKKVERP